MSCTCPRALPPRSRRCFFNPSFDGINFVLTAEQFFRIECSQSIDFTINAVQIVTVISHCRFICSKKCIGCIIFSIDLYLQFCDLLF